MPRIDTGRIEAGTGNVTYREDASLLPAPENATLPVAQSVCVRSVEGANIGFGSGLFAGTNGVEDVVLEFRSLLAGDGLSIEEGTETLTIRLTELPARRFTSLLDTPDAIVNNGIVYGNPTEERIEFLSPPSFPDAVIRWRNMGIEWVPRNRGTVERVAMTGTDGITVAGGPITTIGAFTIGLENLNVAGTYTAPTVVVDAQGRIRSAVSNPIGEVNVGINIGLGDGQLYAGKIGSTLLFRSLHGQGAISIQQADDEVLLDLETLGVAGTYSLPTVSVDMYGRITEAVSRRIVGTQGVVVTELDGTITIAAPEALLTVASNGTDLGLFTRLDFVGPLAVTEPTPGTARVALQDPPIVSATSLGTGIGVFADIQSGIARFRSISGGSGVSVADENDTIVVSSPRLSVQHGASLFTDITTIVAGSFISVVATLTPGVVQLDFSLPPAPISQVTNASFLGATLVRGNVNGTVQINRIAAGANIRITETPDSIFISGPQVAGSGGITASYNTTTNQFVLSAPAPVNIGRLNGQGGVGPDETGLNTGYALTQFGLNTYARRIRVEGGLAIRTGGVPTFGQDPELIIDASAYSTLLAPSGVVAGTYSFPRIGVNALGRITSASSGSLPSWSVSNLGTIGQPIVTAATLPPSGTASFRRISAVAPIEVGSLPDRIVLSMAEAEVVAGVYSNPSVQVDEYGLVQGIAGAAGLITGITAHIMTFQFAANDVVSASAPVGWTATVVDDQTVRFTHNLGRIPASVFFSADRTDGTTQGVGPSTNTFRTVDGIAPLPNTTASNLAIGVDGNNITVYGATPTRIGSDGSGARGLVTVIVVI